MLITSIMGARRKGRTTEQQNTGVVLSVFCICHRIDIDAIELLFLRKVFLWHQQVIFGHRPIALKALVFGRVVGARRLQLNFKSS